MRQEKCIKRTHVAQIVQLFGAGPLFGVIKPFLSSNQDWRDTCFSPQRDFPRARRWNQEIRWHVMGTITPVRPRLCLWALTLPVSAFADELIKDAAHGTRIA